MSDTIQKITVYRIKELASFDDLSFSGYTKVFEGTKQIGNHILEYKLFFLNHYKKTPQWFNVFSELEIAPEHIPVAQTTGFIMTVKIAESYYMFTGGIGHIRVRESMTIEPRFGVILAEKILSIPELKGLTQKDTSGVVNFLDRAFRTKYNPQGDVSNLQRILTNIRGKLSDENAHYETIGKSIQAGNALTVNGAKTFDDLLDFLIQVEDLWQNGERIINIPQLRCIEKRFEPELIERLENRLIEDICSLPNNENTLFLDNEQMGYLPDRINKYEIKLGRRREECDTYDEVFITVARIFNEIVEAERRKLFHRLRLILTFDDDTTEEDVLFYFICGDVILDNEYYFLNNKLWYKANDEYVSKLNAEIDNIRFVSPEDLYLNEWNDDQHTGRNGEFLYNQSNEVYVCLDHKLVSISNERGGIEFCDLLKESNGVVRLIHVKKDCGAALRALFAQGFVSAQLYAEEGEFRTKVHTGDLKREAPELSDDDRQLLAGLSTKQKNQIEIIFAIYDNTESHVVISHPQKTSEWLNGTLTTFAKVDLINRISSVRAMGYNVSITRIKPYPA